MKSYLFRNRTVYILLISLLIFSCSGGKKLKNPIPQLITEEISNSESATDASDYFDSVFVSSTNTCEEVQTFSRMKSVRRESMKVIDQFDKEEATKKTKPNKSKRSKSKSDTDSVATKPEVKLGTLVYQLPDTMIYKKTYIIKIRINRDTLDKAILKNIEKITKTTSIKTTEKMEVLIVDPSSEKSFEIVKSNDETQHIESDDYTEWVYGVTPIKSGKLKINIVISIIKSDGKKQIVYIDTVYVKSNPVRSVNDFLTENWKWLITTIIIPIVGWYYNKKRKKRAVRKKCI